MRKNILILFVSLLAVSVSFSQEIPNVRAWNPEKLYRVRKEIRDAKYRSAYEELIKEAEKEMKKGPYSVMEKTMVPPSGDKHDYVSMGPYWWPNPDTADGLPYIRKDGQRNPELSDLDAPKKSRMMNSTQTLALAWYFSNDIKYADKAAEIISAWFLDAKTKMNPNLNFGQYIPGRSDGRGVGLIETYDFVHLLDAIELLRMSGAISKKEYEKLKSWFSEFETWMVESKNGKDERNAKNNHGLAYDVQLTAIAMFTGNKELYTELLNDFSEKRIYKQIEPDGSQPLELERTLAYSYSRFNIKHMLDMVELGNRVGINLLDSISPDGRSIAKAVEFLLPYIGKKDEWPYQQIRDWERMDKEICWLLRRMAVGTSDMLYEEKRKDFNFTTSKDRENLLYSLE